MKGILVYAVHVGTYTVCSCMITILWVTHLGEVVY